MMDYSGETRWEAGRAWAWYRALPWLCGFNYVPSTAVNTTEMWQAETFDPQTIDRELGWAHSLGLNICRVFLQYLVWESDPEVFLARLERFLTLAAKQQISTMLCLFDDCAFSEKQPYIGAQAGSPQQWLDSQPRARAGC